VSTDGGRGHRHPRERAQSGNASRLDYTRERATSAHNRTVRQGATDLRRDRRSSRGASARCGPSILFLKPRHQRFDNTLELGCGDSDERRLERVERAV